MDNQLISTIKSFFDDENNYDEVTILANTSAIINQLFPNINWVGFYLYKNNILKLGPFQGKPACMEIKLENGVCGWSARNQKSIIVNNVHEFEGHIACDSASNSELVIPIIIDNVLYGVLDIDSPLYNRFSDCDLQIMEDVIKIISKKIKRL
jgi:GAF domain-containing protein